MKTRVIAAAVLLPLLLVILLVLPKVFTAILFGAMASIAAYELLRGTGLVNHMRLIAYSMVMAFLVSMWCYFGRSHAVGVLGIVAFFAAMFGEMMASHIKISFEKISYCMIAGLLIPYLFTSIVRIHMVKSTGIYFVLLPFTIAFLSDTGAYFAGRAFGQHKLAPVISPNKTVEGVVGGILAAVIGMLLYTLILRIGFHFRVNYAYAVLYGLIGSVGAVFGDLSFSVVKRQTGIKDYGNLIPGHGGILDRFDSMMMVGPMTEALLLLIPVAVK